MVNHSARGGHRGSVPWPVVAALSAPEILSAVEPANGYQRFGPRSIPKITGSNRRLVDFPQMMIKRQEKSWPIRLCTTSDDFPGCR